MTSNLNFKTKPTALAPVATTSTPTQSVFDALPDSALLRVSHLVRSPKRPNSTAPLPFSAATLWRMVQAGKFPAPAKISARVTAWQCASVRQWLAAHAAAREVQQ
jgi:predicted DNA-binding transcriptional regulator AlpA